MRWSSVRTVEVVDGDNDGDDDDDDDDYYRRHEMQNNVRIPETIKRALKECIL